MVIHFFDVFGNFFLCTVYCAQKEKLKKCAQTKKQDSVHKFVHKCLCTKHLCTNKRGKKCAQITLQSGESFCAQKKSNQYCAQIRQRIKCA